MCRSVEQFRSAAAVSDCSTRTSCQRQTFRETRIRRVPRWLLCLFSSTRYFPHSFLAFLPAISAPLDFRTASLSIALLPLFSSLLLPFQNGRDLASGKVSETHRQSISLLLSLAFCQLHYFHSLLFLFSLSPVSFLTPTVLLLVCNF